tara:strand:- start:32145 stop:33206 length:1062 start_codon:yes stop_codon:yes gene_type:complete
MKILVIQQKMIGDVLTSSILFEALRKEYPSSQLHYLIYAHTLPVIKQNPFINKVILFKDDLKHPLKFNSFLKKIKREKYDVVIDVYSKFGTAIITKFSGAPVRISYNKWYTHSFYTHCFEKSIIAKTNAGPAIEKRLRLLTPIMKQLPADVKPKIYLAREEKIKAQEQLANAGIKKDKLILMIAVLGSSASKTYPEEYQAQLLDKIVEDTQAQLIFNYIPSQKDEALKVYNLCKPRTQKAIFFDLFGKDLREFLALTYYCDALIGNEGGAINMAKALNVPTFSIFSPGVPKENWNMYENGTTNVSVHLNDYLPKLFIFQTNKEIHNNSPDLYSTFEPSYFEEKLQKFIFNLRS